MKLQEGDYVKNLTEKQWNELLDIENHQYRIPYDNKDYDTINFFGNGFVYSQCHLLHSMKYKCTQELTFRQFKSRAKNTFSHG